MNFFDDDKRFSRKERKENLLRKARKQFKNGSKRDKKGLIVREARERVQEEDFAFIDQI